MWTAKTRSDHKGAAAQPRRTAKTAGNVRPQRSRPQKIEPAAVHQPGARVPQNSQRSTENYLQHAEHYLRSMRSQESTGRSNDHASHHRGLRPIKAVPFEAGNPSAALPLSAKAEVASERIAMEDQEQFSARQRSGSTPQSDHIRSPAKPDHSHMTDRPRMP